MNSNRELLSFQPTRHSQQSLVSVSGNSIIPDLALPSSISSNVNHSPSKKYAIHPIRQSISSDSSTRSSSPSPSPSAGPSSPPNNNCMVNLPTNNMPPRSASEAGVDSTNKFRQLPCRTFISVGTCPYRERCVYLHDPRCICREAKTKTRRKNKEDAILDSLFWPIMPYHLISAKLDNNRQPHVIQPYNVPIPQNDQFKRHDEAVYSMWMHFVDFCMANSESASFITAGGEKVARIAEAPCFNAPDIPTNPYTKGHRLPVFRALSTAASVPNDVAKVAPVKTAPVVCLPAFGVVSPGSPTTVTSSSLHSHNTNPSSMSSKVLSFPQPSGRGKVESSHSSEMSVATTRDSRSSSSSAASGILEELMGCERELALEIELEDAIFS